MVESIAGRILILGSTIRVSAYTQNDLIPLEWKPLAVSLILVVLYFLGRWIVRKIIAKYRGDRASEPTILEPRPVHPISLLLGRLPQQEISETTKQGDATSVEFRMFFTDLIKECLPDGSHRTLVMVLDNLDRVTPEEALSIWSTMRLFFDPYEMSRTPQFLGHHQASRMDAHADDGVAPADQGAEKCADPHRGHPENGDEKPQPGWQKRLWVIVPFDPAAVDRFWEAGRLQQELCDVPSTSGEEASEGTEDLTPNSKRSDISEYSYGSDQSINPLGQIFRDKTFQTTFHVSQPLPTALQDFFEQQSANAFGRCTWMDKEDIHRLWMVYSYYLWNLRKVAIPRDVKIFINEVVALVTVWQDTIRLPVLGVYVLLKKCGTSSAGTPKGVSKIHDSLLHMLQAWRSDAEPSQNSVPPLDEVIRAVQLNADPGRVQELSILKALADLLQTGDIDDILSRFRDAPTFVKVMETTLINFSEAWTTASPVTLGYAALVLKDVSAEQPESRLLNSCWELLNHRVLNVKNWRSVNAISGEGLAALIRERRDAITSQDRIDFVKAMAISRPKSRGHDPNSKIRIEEFTTITPLPIKCWFL